jgi:PAS domain S-box-containing protein
MNLQLWKRVREQDEGSPSFEVDCLRADGSRMPADVSLSFLRYRQAEYLVVFLSDVTERRRARAALEESEARFKGNPTALSFEVLAAVSRGA